MFTLFLLESWHHNQVHVDGFFFEFFSFTNTVKNSFSFNLGFCRGDDEYLFVGDAGIKTGDFFRFYHSDSSIALSSCSNVSDHLRRLKPDCSNHPSVGPSNGSKKDIFGGIIFSCCGRGESLFGKSNVDSSPMLENFPGVTLAGSFCGGEIARGDSSWYSSQESQGGGGSVSCCLHVFSTVYLVMSYTPPPPQKLDFLMRV